jgi:hypothetical protein
MTTCCDFDGTFTILELPSPTFPFPFVFLVIILLVLPPLADLPIKGLHDGVALKLPIYGVGEIVFGVLIPLVNLFVFTHPTYHDFFLKEGKLMPFCSSVETVPKRPVNQIG